MKSTLPAWISLVLAGAPLAAADGRIRTDHEEILAAIESAPLRLQFTGSTSAELTAWQAEFTGKLRHAIGPHAPPAQWRVEKLNTITFPDHVREELLLTAEGGLAVPLFVLRPAAAASSVKFPVILALHGHGTFGHDSVAGVDDTPAQAEEIRKLNYDYGRQLAREGYLVVAPGLKPFGRRLDAASRDAKNDPCAAGFLRLMFLGRTLVGDNLRDALWALNYAAGRPDARADRLGCVGLSLGGRMTMMVAALEPRIRIAVISGALNVFQERATRAGYSCGAQVIPGLLEFGDTPEIGALIAPRPAIWETGTKDRLIDPAWAARATERLRRAYIASGAPDNLAFHRFEGGHQWHGAAALPLLARALQHD